MYVHRPHSAPSVTHAQASKDASRDQSNPDVDSDADEDGPSSALTKKVRSTGKAIGPMPMFGRR